MAISRNFLSSAQNTGMRSWPEKPPRYARRASIWSGCLLHRSPVASAPATTQGSTLSSTTAMGPSRNTEQRLRLFSPTVSNRLRTSSSIIGTAATNGPTSIIRRGEHGRSPGMTKHSPIRIRKCTIRLFRNGALRRRTRRIVRQATTRMMRFATSITPTCRFGATSSAISCS
jgi:hypothetical protein